jgi:hypothetical protein
MNKTEHKMADRHQLNKAILDVVKLMWVTAFASALLVVQGYYPDL